MHEKANQEKTRMLLTYLYIGSDRIIVLKSQTLFSSPSMASLSLTTDLHHHNPGGGTSSSLTTPSPPPPTPSNHSFPTNPDDLTRFLHQLRISPPPLLLSRHSRSHPPPQTPLISLLGSHHDLLLSAASSLGFFHLSEHGIPSHLHDSALRESQTLISSSPRDVSALGFGHLDDDDEEEESDGRDPIIVLDADDDSAGDLRLLEYARQLKRVGLEVMGLLFGGNPFGEGKMKAKCLMWISSRTPPPPSYSGCGIGEEDKVRIGKGYPYVMCLQYEGKGREPSWVMGDSGEWIAVPPQDDSLLVTLGDIAQVWSNGKFKKVRGRPQPSPLPSGDCSTSGYISLSMLITLPLDSVISPLVPSVVEDSKHQSTDRADDGGRKFHPFSLEEYAWRVFHERLPLKDPLTRYQI